MPSVCSVVSTNFFCLLVMVVVVFSVSRASFRLEASLSLYDELPKVEPRESLKLRPRVSMSSGGMSCIKLAVVFAGC